MRAYFLPPFAAAIRAGVATGMVSYNAVDGLPMVISRKWTRTWLRKEQRFAGMLVTDWQEIYNQLQWHYSAATGSEAVELALTRSSIDMVRQASLSCTNMDQAIKVDQRRSNIPMQSGVEMGTKFCEKLGSQRPSHVTRVKVPDTEIIR